MKDIEPTGIEPEDVVDALNDLAEKAKNADAEKVEHGKEYGTKLRELANEYHAAYGITTQTVFGYPDVLDHAFIGGVQVTHEGTESQSIEIFYQLARAIYRQISDNHRKGFADLVFEKITKDLKDGKDYFSLVPDITPSALENLKEILRNILDLDDDFDTEDEE